MRVTLLGMLVAVACVGCGDDVDDGGMSSTPAPNGQVVAPYDELCVATIAEPFDILYSFNEVVISVEAGERYLQGARLFSGDSIIYIAHAGQIEIDLDVDAPITSTCTGRTEQFAAVFVDTDVYADRELTRPLCTLEAGLIAPGAVGLALVGQVFESSTYVISFDGLEEHCDGVNEGFVASTEVTVGSSRHIGIGLTTVLGAASP